MGRRRRKILRYSAFLLAVNNSANVSTGRIVMFLMKNGELSLAAMISEIEVHFEEGKKVNSR